MGRARSMPCVISNYSNVSSDLGTWMFYIVLRIVPLTLKVREKIRQSFVTDLTKFRNFFIRQSVCFVSQSTGRKPPYDISFTAPRSFVFGLTHRVRSGSRDDCACMAPGSARVVG